MDAAHIGAMKKMSLTFALAAVFLLAGCSGAAPAAGPGWAPNPACAITGPDGSTVEVPCPPASPDSNPVRVLSEKVEAGLRDGEAGRKLLEAADELCVLSGAEVCDVEAILNEQLPHLQTR